MKNLILALFVGFGLSVAVSSQQAQAADCSAYTFCPNLGTTVYCETYGMNCSWYVQPYQYVQCTGFNLYGFWVNIVQRCF